MLHAVGEVRRIQEVEGQAVHGVASLGQVDRRADQERTRPAGFLDAQALELEPVLEQRDLRSAPNTVGA